MKWTCLSAISLVFFLQKNLAVASGNDGEVPPLEEEARVGAAPQRAPDELPPVIGAASLNPYALRIAALRNCLQRDNLDGYIVPHNDEYQTEELAPSSKRLEWLTGFTGSAGTALVMGDEARLFVDGRYELQAQRQVPPEIQVIRGSLETWLSAPERSTSLRLGIDPKLYKDQEFKALQKKPDPVIEFVEIDENPVDELWIERPPSPANIIQLYPEGYAGESSVSKITRVTEKLRKDGIETAIISDPNAIAWLLNIRGAQSLAYTPIVLGILLLHGDGHSDFFVHTQREQPEISLEVREYLQSLRVTSHPMADIDGFKHVLEGKRVLVDERLVSRWLVRNIPSSANLIYGEDPSWESMVAKNPTEIANMRLAHICDGVALCNFLCRLNLTHRLGRLNLVHRAPPLTEKSLADELWELRREASKKFLGFGGKDFLTSPSFPTISAFGANAALPHYSVEAIGRDEAGASIGDNNLYLVDSGAQYSNGGTTDITRTVILGEPTKEQKNNFTRVLKGHIALANAQFPKKTSGRKLYALARQFLWEAGMDYGHGTGHGVGSYLAFHEQPETNFSDRSAVPLHEGMVVSNEPGYYKSGENGYGIRIENLMLVVPAPQEGFSCFEIISLAPIDKRLIRPEMLTDREKAWLDNYHQLVFKRLSPHTKGTPTYEWLQEATAPLDRTYDEGFAITKQEDTMSAEKLTQGMNSIKKAAKNGRVAAQRRLGMYYFYGTLSCPRNLPKAFKWYSRVSESPLYSRDVDWLDALAEMHEYGFGIPRNPERALALSIQAAESKDDDKVGKGSLEAQYRLAWMYQQGWGVPQDVEKSKQYKALTHNRGHLPETSLIAYEKWIREHGSAESAMFLGEYYETGYATLKDLREKKKDLREEKEDLREKGKDLREALKYYRNALRLGLRTEAQKRIDRLQQELLKEEYR